MSQVEYKSQAEQAQKTRGKWKFCVIAFLKITRFLRTPFWPGSSFSVTALGNAAPLFSPFIYFLSESEKSQAGCFCMCFMGRFAWGRGDACVCHRPGSPFCLAPTASKAFGFFRFHCCSGSTATTGSTNRGKNALKKWGKNSASELRPSLSRKQTAYVGFCLCFTQQTAQWQMSNGFML